MTEQEWKRRCVQRIWRAVKSAGQIRMRDLKRKTHYNRGPEGEGIAIWYDALDSLERRKYIVLERDAYDREIRALLPAVAEALNVRTVSPVVDSVMES